MEERMELAMPKRWGGFIFSLVIFIIAAFSTAVAVLELLFRVALVLPLVWLAIVVLLTWSAWEAEGGFLEWLVRFLGSFAGRQFVASGRQHAGNIEIQFGYYLFGRRLHYFKVPLNKIETIEWSPAQNPSYWIVCVWFDHDDPKKSLARQKWARKPDQDVYCVEPYGSKAETEALGRRIIDFLSRAGAKLLPGKDDCAFVRAT
jgi:hypothetical protein